jgi:hypothetical protein
VNGREHWRQIFDAIAEDLCAALERGDVISRFAQKEADTPDGLASYGSVLAIFEGSDDNV